MTYLQSPIGMIEVLGVQYNIIKTESKQSEQKFTLIRVEPNTRKTVDKKTGSASLIMQSRHLYF